ncbi:sperm surface protein Sp17 isoform X2 [Prinia subflava]
MSIAYSNTNMRVPAGFRNLLEGLAREVLREQPTNVVAFAAQHFQKLLEQREAGGTDPVAWGAMLEDDHLTWPPSQDFFNTSVPPSQTTTAGCSQQVLPDALPLLPLQNLSCLLGIRILEVLEHLKNHLPDEGVQGGKMRSLEQVQNPPLMIRNVLAFRVPPPQPQPAGDGGARRLCQDPGATDGAVFGG